MVTNKNAQLAESVTSTDSTTKPKFALPAALIPQIGKGDRVEVATSSAQVNTVPEQETVAPKIPTRPFFKGLGS